MRLRLQVAAQLIVGIGVIVLEVQVSVESERMGNHHVVHSIAATREVAVCDQAEEERQTARRKKRRRIRSSFDSNQARAVDQAREAALISVGRRWRR